MGEKCLAPLLNAIFGGSTKYRIAQSTQTKRVLVKSVIQHFLDEIVAELVEGNRLEFRDFGVFETRIRAARDARNPKTLEQVHIPAKRTVANDCRLSARLWTVNLTVNSSVIRKDN